MLFLLAAIIRGGAPAADGTTTTQSTRLDDANQKRDLLVSFKSGTAATVRMSINSSPKTAGASSDAPSFVAAGASGPVTAAGGRNVEDGDGIPVESHYGVPLARFQRDHAARWNEILLGGLHYHRHRTASNGTSGAELPLIFDSDAGWGVNPGSHRGDPPHVATMEDVIWSSMVDRHETNCQSTGKRANDDDFWRPSLYTRILAVSSAPVSFSPPSAAEAAPTAANTADGVEWRRILIATFWDREGRRPTCRGGDSVRVRVMHPDGSPMSPGPRVVTLSPSSDASVLHVHIAVNRVSDMGLGLYEAWLRVPRMLLQLLPLSDGGEQDDAVEGWSIEAAVCATVAMSFPASSTRHRRQVLTSTSLPASIKVAKYANHIAVGQLRRHADVNGVVASLPIDDAPSVGFTSEGEATNAATRGNATAGDAPRPPVAGLPRYPLWVLPINDDWLDDYERTAATMQEEERGGGTPVPTSSPPKMPIRSPTPNEAVQASDEALLTAASREAMLKRMWSSRSRSLPLNWATFPAAVPTPPPGVLASDNDTFSAPHRRTAAYALNGQTQPYYYPLSMMPDPVLKRYLAATVCPTGRDSAPWVDSAANGECFPLRLALRRPRRSALLRRSPPVPMPSHPEGSEGPPASTRNTESPSAVDTSVGNPKRRPSCRFYRHPNALRHGHWVKLRLAPLPRGSARTTENASRSVVGAGHQCTPPVCTGHLPVLDSGGWVWTSEHCVPHVYSHEEAWRLLDRVWLLGWGDSTLKQPLANFLEYHLMQPVLDVFMEQLDAFKAMILNPKIPRPLWFHQNVPPVKWNARLLPTFFSYRLFHVVRQQPARSDSIPDFVSTWASFPTVGAWLDRHQTPILPNETSEGPSTTALRRSEPQGGRRGKLQYSFAWGGCPSTAMQYTCGDAMGARNKHQISSLRGGVKAITEMERRLLFLSRTQHASRSNGSGGDRRADVVYPPLDVDEKRKENVVADGWRPRQTTAAAPDTSPMQMPPRPDLAWTGQVRSPPSRIVSLANGTVRRDVPLLPDVVLLNHFHWRYPKGDEQLFLDSVDDAIGYVLQMYIDFNQSLPLMLYLSMSTFGFPDAAAAADLPTNRDVPGNATASPSSSRWNASRRLSRCMQVPHEELDMRLNRKLERHLLRRAAAAVLASEDVEDDATSPSEAPTAADDVSTDLRRQRGQLKRSLLARSRHRQGPNAAQDDSKTGSPRFVSGERLIVIGRAELTWPFHHDHRHVRKNVHYGNSKGMCSTASSRNVACVGLTLADDMLMQLVLNAIEANIDVYRGPRPEQETHLIY